MDLVVVVAINVTAIGRAPAVTIQTLHGEMNATDAKSQNPVDHRAVLMVALAAVHHAAEVVSIDAIKDRCVAAVIVVMIAIGHTNNKQTNQQKTIQLIHFNLMTIGKVTTCINFLNNMRIIRTTTTHILNKERIAICTKRL